MGVVDIAGKVVLLEHILALGCRIVWSGELSEICGCCLINQYTPRDTLLRG